MSSRSKPSSEFFAKINVYGVFVSHLNTLKNYRQSVYSKADIFLFFGLPVIFSVAIVYANFRLTESLIGILINVFAIFAGLLFNLLVLVYDVLSKAVRQDSSVQENSLSLDKLEAISSNVSFEVILSILNVLLLAVSASFTKSVINIIFSLVIFYLVIVFTLTLFMILKRVHRLLSDEVEHQKRILANKS